MKTTLDCIPCFVRQGLEAARLVSADTSVHERIVRDVLQWASEIDLDQTPPFLAQRIHRRLRKITGAKDPYGAAKARQNRLALDLSPKLKAEVDAAKDPLAMAVRLAIAGNIIDMGVRGDISESDVRRSMEQALAEPVSGAWDDFRRALERAGRILYLADNAGEIVFDRMLIEQLSPGRVTLAVRGAPVINDATLADARAAGLHEVVDIIDNGSDAPGTILEDCSRAFRQRFAAADMIIAKGQGNFETLSGEARNIFFLFKVKCPVIADHAGLPVGTHALVRPCP
jgi:damage-control phosphatase, subfamily I